MTTEPRFKLGDRVRVQHGLSKVWTVVAVEALPGRPVGYVLEDSRRRRTADESALTPAFAETPADREAWFDRHSDSAGKETPA